MGLFTYTLAGTSLILIGALESLFSIKPTNTKKISPFSFSSFSSLTTSLLSLLFILNSFISLFDSLNSEDDTGLVLQLQIVAVSALFLLYSVLTFIKDWIFFPSQLLNLLSLFAFIEEFLIFYLRRKDVDGIENRYFDLLLFPIGVCVFSTALELKTTNGSRFARLGRGIGLVSQGSWIIQMGFSFYSSLLAHGCVLHEKSRGNYTIKCRSHAEYHRARAIATLQFNCQLALLVVSVVTVYSVFCRKNGFGGENGVRYKPIGAEMQELDRRSEFTLDSDDDDVASAEEGKGIVVVTEPVANGYGGGAD